MNPIVVQQMASHQMDTFDREAGANAASRSSKRSAARPVVFARA